jgi:hypothetical protein
MTSALRMPVAVLLAAVLLGSAGAQAQTGWHEEFETAEPSWRVTGGDATYRVVQHQRVQDNSHGGKGSEWVQIEGSGGSYVYFAHDVGKPSIINELTASVWIKSNRPGLQIFAQVILPRATDPRSGHPMTAQIAGTVYTDVGRWQQLQITDLPRSLTRQIHLLRMQFGPQVDGREAFIDSVLLNVYGGPGATSVWIDDLEVAGHVQTGRNATPGEQPPSAPAATASAGSQAIGSLVPVRLPPIQPRGRTGAADPPAKGTLPIAAVSEKRRVVKLAESKLQVNDRPMFPRVVQHRGEPLGVLKKIGFNVVWLQRLPAPEILEEADRLGLWLICPPPRAEGTMAEIGPAFDSVLAWDLGSGLTGAELDAVQGWADQVRTADRRGNRPMICCPRTDLRGYSRVADVLLIDRRPLGTSLELADYAAWVQRQPLLASPGTPIWTTVQTQPNESVRQQLAAFEPGSTPPLCMPTDQIRLLAYTAVASGSRGLLFLSDSPLDATDPDTQQRAMSLELLNLELAVLEPWAAAGSYVGLAEPSTREVTGAVLRADQARLLLPIWTAPQSQYVVPQSAANDLTLLVPGVPETNNAYELTPGGVRPLRHPLRIAGGMQVHLPEFGLTTQVLLAHDPSIVGAVRGKTEEIGRRAAELHRDLAAYRLTVVERVAGQLDSRTHIAAVPGWLDAARRDMQACSRQLTAGDASAATLSADRATRALRLVERAYWDAAVKELSSPATSPAAVSFDTLALHWRLFDRLKRSQLGPSRIAGGDFEDMGTMMRSGWQYVPNVPPENLQAQSEPNVQTAVDLTPDAMHSGRLGLRLLVTAKNPPAVIESPPILFTSPAVQVEAGQIVCIHGWVQVFMPPTGGDGLLIVDSLTGEALAERIGKTKGWQQFALYRIAPQSGTMCVTFALPGLGEARLDDVFIQTVENAAALTQR